MLLPVFRPLIGGILAAGLLAAAPVSDSEADADSVADLAAGNRLANPGFEGEFRPVGENELVVAQDWQPWYRAELTRPEFKDERHARLRADGGVESFSLRVMGGEVVQKMFTSSAAHDAGFYQRVAALPGERLRFSIWAQAWSSDCDDPCVSPLEPCRVGSTNTHGTYRVSVGIHTEGHVPAHLGDAPPEGVLWSAPVVFEAYDNWFRLQVEAVAAGPFVTVFTRGNPEWGVKHNDSYWDNARLEVVTRLELPFSAYLPAALRTSDFAPAIRGDSDAYPVPPTGAERIERRPGWGADPAPPGAEVRIEYPIRAYPDQENFRQRTCSVLEFQSVLIKNYGAVDLAMEDWTLSDRDGNTYLFPRLTLEPDGQVRVWTKRGPDTRLGQFFDLYWQRDEPVWDGPGPDEPFDVAVLKDSEGREMARRGYP